MLVRSLLFVPGNRERMLQRAPSSGADVVVIDLEDAVPREEKGDARRLVRASMGSLAQLPPPLFVRVNNVHSGLARNDLMAVVRPGLAGVVHPKTERPQDLRDLDVLLREAEVRNGVRPGDVRVIPLIESPAGVLRCEEIATAIDRVDGLSIGAEDYCASLGVRRDAEGVAIVHLRYTIVTVAAALGIFAIDTPWTALDDDAGLRADAGRARAMGFSGKYVIHPDQVATVNDAFSPSADDVAAARRIVAETSRSARGRGAIRLDGRMVDEAVLRQARRVIEAADAIGARDVRAPDERAKKKPGR